MTFFYNVGIWLYHMLVRASALFDPKAKEWISGRSRIFERIAQDVDPSARRAWVHCASLGEFEQGRPVIERLRQEFPEMEILITFFSPSVYKVIRDYEHANHVFYLPLDTARNARRFLELVEPDLIVFVKYEFWYHFLTEASRRSIPTVVIAASFRPDHRFFKWYGGLFRKMLAGISHIFVQTKESIDLLREIGIDSCSISGDTRYDRSFQQAKDPEPVELVARFKGERKVFIAGSTWPLGEEVIVQLINDNVFEGKFIIAPHEISEARMEQLANSINRPVAFFTKCSIDTIHEYDVMIVDTVGYLTRIYQYGDYAYVGGGFSPFLHNTLEAFAFGLPTFFGPQYDKFWEAQEAVKNGAGFPISNIEDLKAQLSLLESDPMIYGMASEMSRNLIRQNTGATDKVMAYLVEKLR